MKLVLAALAALAAAAAQAPAPAPLPAVQLEIRLVVEASGAGGALDLAAERQRLLAWLGQDDNRTRVLASPRHLERFHELSADQGGRKSQGLRWCPRVLSGEGEAKERFAASEALTEGSPVVALFSAEDWAAGPKPGRTDLLELYPLDLEATWFGSADVARLAAVTDPVSGGPALRYEVAAERARQYRDWTAANAGRRCAFVVDGVVRMALRLGKAIVASGTISGFSDQEAAQLAARLAPPAAGDTAVSAGTGGAVPAGSDPADLRAIQGAQAMLEAEKRLRELIKAGKVAGIDKILTFEEIASWPYEDGLQGCPAPVKKLDGQSVLMTGFMLPIDEVENIKEFLLVQSLWSCCYGSPPDINGIVRVVMRGGARIDYQFDPIKVTGTFKVQATVEDGYCVDIYQLSADSVEVIR